MMKQLCPGQDKRVARGALRFVGMFECINFTELHQELSSLMSQCNILFVWVSSAVKCLQCCISSCLSPGCAPLDATLITALTKPMYCYLQSSYRPCHLAGCLRPWDFACLLCIQARVKCPVSENGKSQSQGTLFRETHQVSCRVSTQRHSGCAKRTRSSHWRCGRW